MKILNYLKKILFKFYGYVVYKYYTISKNKYLFKLVSEKYCHITQTSKIAIKFKGVTNIYEFSINELLADSQIIANFHPLEAVKLGGILFDSHILSLSLKDRNERYNQLKQTLFVSPELFDYLLLKNCLASNNESLHKLFNIAGKQSNHYLLKLVGGRVNKHDHNLKILYTICGKRDGYEKNLKEIINNSDLISRFHPFDALKLSFLNFGELLFNSDVKHRYNIY